MNRRLLASCNKTLINRINNNNNIGGTIMDMPGSYISSPTMASSGQARRRSLEEEADRTFSPWTGRLVFAKTEPDDRNIRDKEDLMINGRSGSDEPCEGMSSGSSSGHASFSDQEDEVEHIKTVNHIRNQKHTLHETTADNRQGGSSLLIDRIIDLTLSPSPPRRSVRDDQMFASPLRARPRAVARYASPECKTAMSPLRNRVGGVSQPKAINKNLHPFFNPAALKSDSPGSLPTFTPPPLSHIPRLSMRTIQPGSQSTESATSGSQASTSTYTSSSTGTSTASPDSYRRPVQVLRGLQNSRVVIEERIVSGQRGYRTWGARQEVAEVPDELVLDFDALTLGRQPNQNAPKATPAPEPRREEPVVREPYVPKRPVNKEFFDPVDALPFFTYTSLKPKPTLVYTCCPDEADDLLVLLKGDVVGFDMEWPVTYRAQKGVAGARRLEDKTALVQVCDDKVVLLLHLSKMRSFPQGLKDLINSEKIFKVGVNIKGDARKISLDYPYVKPRSMLDLSFLARVADPENCGNGSTLISLARLTRGYVGCDLNKDNGVRKSDWSTALSSEQQEYAANDVVVSMAIYHKLIGLAGERGAHVDRDAICNPPPPPPPSSTSRATYWAPRKSWSQK